MPLKSFNGSVCFRHKPFPPVSFASAGKMHSTLFQLADFTVEFGFFLNALQTDFTKIQSFDNCSYTISRAPAHLILDDWK